MYSETDFSKIFVECKSVVERVDKLTEEDKNAGSKYRIRWRSQHTGFESGGDPMSFKMVEALIGRRLTPESTWCQEGIYHWIEKVPELEDVD